MKRLPLFLMLAVVTGASAAMSQTAADLKGAFGREAQLLDEAIDDFGRSRTRERAAIEELRQLSSQLDEALADPNVSLDYLSELEARLGVPPPDGGSS